MANIFTAQSKRKFHAVILLILGVVGGLIGWLYFLNFNDLDYAPTQPVAFSHKKHVEELKMDCTACHTAAYHSPKAGLPDTRSCLNCHKHILPDSPLIAPLRKAADPQYKNYTGAPIRWIQISRLAGHARFNHMVHVNRGIGCTSCHGDVSQMETTSQSQQARMKWCMDCHRSPASHLRPLEYITEADYSAEKFLKSHKIIHNNKQITTQQELGEFLQQQWKIRPSLNCTSCHQ